MSNHKVLAGQIIPKQGTRFLKLSACILALAAFASSNWNCAAADLEKKTVEVYNTGGIGLKAWTSTCSGTYVNKADASRGIVTSTSSTLCGGFNRWKIRWAGDTIDRWSAEDYLRVVPADLTVSGAVSVYPSPVLPGSTIRVSCSIANIGQGNARPSATKITVFRAVTFDTIVTQDWIETAEVSPSQSIPFFYDITLPQPLAAGNYLAQVEVDSQDTIGQINYANDVKSSPNFTVTPSTYTVTATAGLGGAVSPVGAQTVTANGSITFTATPEATTTVDQWLVESAVRQTGGTTFTLSPVEGNTTVSVTFKAKTYSLDVASVNGSVTVTPQLTAYPHGGEVLLSAYPAQNYWLYDWRGDVPGVGNTLRFRVTRDTRIQAFFQPLTVPVSMQVAGSTPALGYNISIPLSPEMLHVVQITDSSYCWRNLAVYDGNSACTVTFNPLGATGMNIYRTMDVPRITTPPFLNFPVKNGTSRNTQVSSIFDHSGAFGNPDGSIMSYKSELLKITTADGWRYDEGLGQNLRVNANPNSPDYYGRFRIVGYTRNSSSQKPLIFTYPDTILWYDGHAGYDYVVDSTRDVIAAAEGEVVPAESRDCWNSICIDHGNGYRTYYLHLSERASNLLLNGVVQPVHVEAGQVIGHPGQVDCNASVGIHLHFSLKRKNEQEQWNYIDPYGKFAEDGNEIEPALWLPGQ